MLAVLVKEFIQLTRDRITYALILAVPVIQMLLFGYAINTDPRHLPTALLVQENSVFARSVVSGIANTSYFEITHQVRTPAELDQLVRTGQVQFAITIPGDFTRRVVRRDRAQILVEADATDPTATGSALAALARLPQEALRHDLAGAVARPAEPAPPFEVVVHRRYNPENITAYNIVPGLLGIVLTLTLVMMTAIGVTREQERGTMESLLATPVQPLEVMIGKLAPFVIVGMIQTALILLARAIALRRADGGRLARADPRHHPVHHRFAGPRLPDLDADPDPAPGDAAFGLLSAAVDPAVGLHVPVPRHAGMGAMAGHDHPGDPFHQDRARRACSRARIFADMGPSLLALAIFVCVVAALALARYRTTLD